MSRDRFPVVAHVLLLRGPAPDRELFLLRRAGTGFMDGYHVPPGGHQRAGEGVAEAAGRECVEETGAVPRDLVPVCLLAYRSGPRHQGLNVVFAAWETVGAPGLGEPQTSDAAAWYPCRDLPRPLAPWLDDALELLDRGDWFRELAWP
ncbi:MAG: NUDIX domain-containing protein [Pseudomonadota bacterium]